MPIHDVLRQRMQPLTAALTSNRIFLYCVFSLFAVVATIANACRAHSNFYSVSIYLSKSSRGVLVLANFGIICSLLLGRVLQKLFFGTLQPREVERLYDQTWMFVTESLLAFTIFRDEFDVPFLLMFGFLLFVKCFHWLMADRVESMDQTTYPGPPTLFHVRISSLFFVLWAVDTMMFALAVESTLTNGVGGMVLFASEYAILLASALNAMLRYILSILDLRRARARGGENAPPWENKSMYIFYIELLTDFLKLATYMTFFMIILTFYGLPLNIIRDVFVTARSFITRLRALIRYHNATRDMDRRYPDATEAELAEMSDRTCIICREEMDLQTRTTVTTGPADQDAPAGQQQQPPPPLPPVDGPNMTPKKLPCGHIFHFQCLRSWLERQQSCPTCRRTVLDNEPTPNTNQAPVPGQGRAARPRAGAAPGQQVAAHPLGWIGRLLGLPANPALNPQFPRAQGQLAQGAAPPGIQQQPQPNAGMGWGVPQFAGQGPPPPPFYDPAHGWQQQPPPVQPGVMQPPPPLHPPPQFRGFYGPGQAWHPWEDPRLYAPQHLPPPHAQDGQAQTPGVIPHPSPTVVDEQQQADTAANQLRTSQEPRPTPSTRVNGTSISAANLRAPHVPASAPGPSESGPSDARAAATLAALRRRQNGSAAASDNLARTTEIQNGAVSASSEPAPPLLHTSSAPGTTEAGAAPTTQSSSTPALPNLIPLYDTGIVQPTRVNGAPTYFTPFNPLYHAPLNARSFRASADLRPLRVGAESSSPTPLHQLPPTLTDEQLARLDRLTREAIDERLRVLEGVSSAVYRCVEELTRVRSVLPQVGREAQDPQRGASLSTESTSTPTSTAAVPPPSTSGADVGKSRASGSGEGSSEAEINGVVVSESNQDASRARGDM